MPRRDAGKPSTIATRMLPVALSVAAIIVAGCASDGGSPIATPVEAGTLSPPSSAPSQAAATYQLTPLEMKLDCAKLTGQMKVKLAILRGDAMNRETSLPSRAMQSAIKPVLGGPSRGADPRADFQRDRAKLEAFNKRLAEKKCKTVDIDAELRGDPPAAAPGKPAPKPPAAKAGG